MASTFALQLLVAVFVAISCGLVAPFVTRRGLSFAVHGVSELAFAGAAVSLLIGGSTLIGGLIGGLLVAVLIGVLGEHQSQRDAATGMLLAVGLAFGAFVLSFQSNSAQAAVDILFGNLSQVTRFDAGLLIALCLLVAAVLGVIYRPLLFATVDPELAKARGVATRALGIIFLLLLAVTVMAAAQVVGTLLVLSLTITPAMAASRLTARPGMVAIWSIVFAVGAAVGGLFMSLLSAHLEPSVSIAMLSFAIYIAERIATIKKK